jgi:hypothetical protein
VDYPEEGQKERGRELTPGAKWFLVCSVDEVEYAIASSPVQHRCMYENVPEGTKVKPYLDVDILVPNEGPAAQREAIAATTELITPCRDSVKAVFAELGVMVDDVNILCDIKPPRVKPNHPGEMAISMHITIVQNGVYFANNKEQKDFWWRMAARDKSTGEIVWRLNKNGVSTGKPRVYLPCGQEIDTCPCVLELWCLACAIWRPGRTHTAGLSPCVFFVHLCS